MLRWRSTRETRLLWLLYQVAGTTAIIYGVGVRGGRGRRSQCRLPWYAGIVLCSSGFALRLWATQEFSTAARSVPIPYREPPRLVVSGPYRYSRNPLFIGKLMICAGLGFLRGSKVFLVIVLAWWAIHNWMIVPMEERVLQRRFGNLYRHYQQRVPRWIGLPRRRHTSPQASADPPPPDGETA